MLDDVLVRLRELGLLKDENAAHCNVFVRLDNVLVNVFDDDGRYYYLRMAEAYDMQREYDVARSVAEVVGRFVPQPLAFFRIGKLSCMVAEGVDFEIVTGAALLDATSSTPAVRELLAFVEYAAGALAAPGSRAHVDDLAEILTARYLGTEQEPLCARVLESSNLAALRELPSQRQHGDFVPNNFGMRGDRLLIFDWEDFGKVDVPGFDLAVLLGSLVDFHPGRLRALRDAKLARAPDAQAEWLDEACRLSRIDTCLFLRSLPFYLSLFMWLKDRYSPAIRLKVNRAVVALL